MTASIPYPTRPGEGFDVGLEPRPYLYVRRAPRRSTREAMVRRLVESPRRGTGLVRWCSPLLFSKLLHAASGLRGHFDRQRARLGKLASPSACSRRATPKSRRAGPRAPGRPRLLEASRMTWTAGPNRYTTDGRQLLVEVGTSSSTAVARVENLTGLVDWPGQRRATT